jgi:ABC-2 type transport system ATP-binding protein
MLLEIKDIVKVYKNKVIANDGISLSIGEGEVFGLLGPNGAGKTTLVNQIIGITVPTSGTITISGVDVVANPAYARKACSFQPQHQLPVYLLPAINAIELVGQIRGLRKADVRRRANELIDRLGISQWRHVIGSKSTGGIRRLVCFCMAVVAPGSIVILDEPTNDIDPLRRRQLWEEVRRLAEAGSAVLLVTHNVHEAERVVDRLAIIDKGKVLGSGTPAELKASEGNSMRLEFIREPDSEPPPLPDFLLETVTSNRRMISKVEKRNIGQALEFAERLKDDGRIEEFSLGPVTLEDMYIRMAGRLEEDEEIPEGERK